MFFGAVPFGFISDVGVGGVVFVNNDLTQLSRRVSLYMIPGIDNSHRKLNKIFKDIVELPSHAPLKIKKIKRHDSEETVVVMKIIKLVEHKYFASTEN